MAKVKLQIALTKPRPQHVWMGYDDDEHGKGRWQAIQYEGVPDYCIYCKHQGHAARTYAIKEKNGVVKRKMDSNDTT